LKGAGLLRQNRDMGELLEILRAKGRMSFAAFMASALYEPKLGYYAQPGRIRVGAGPDADFATAENLGGVFAEMVVAAARQIAGGWMDKGAVFAELGAEPGSPSVASRACPPFARVLVVPRGEEIPTDAPVVLFSNELFDAQPFHRVVRLGGVWRECGVEIVGDRAVEVLLDDFTPEVAAFAPRLPLDAPEGCRIDLPLSAEALMAEIAAKANVVAIVAFDYGLDWDDILLRRPKGTARAYRSQQIADDLLAHPGGQDITCHVAWDGLENVLRRCGFSQVKMESQEAFFMHHAFDAMQAILARKDIVETSKLRELIHPMRMGSAFQVLSATR